MSPAKVDPEVTARRAETLRGLDAVFPEIRATLANETVHAALLAVEEEEVRRFGGDPLRPRSMGEHFFVAARLWLHHWEQLLAPAVQSRLGPTVPVTEKQIFDAANQVIAPKPTSQLDAVCWLVFADAVADQLRATLPRSQSGPDATQSSPNAANREWQNTFATEFSQRLRAHLGKGR